MKNILLHPSCDFWLNNNFFKLEPSGKKMKSKFKEIGYNLITVDCGNLEEAECIIFHDFPEFNNKYLQFCIDNNLKNKMILFLNEPDTVNKRNSDIKNHEYFDIVFTWNDDLIDNIKYFKYNCSQLIEDYKIEKNPCVDFKAKKFCTMVIGNRWSKAKNEVYSERIKAINYFEKYHLDKFEFYGRNWFGTKYKSYKGAIRAQSEVITNNGETHVKIDVLKNYKFCICYENTKNVNGYISEKIFDCFRARCIPIYLGAENINKYIPTNTFIDKRQFSSYEEMYNSLSNMDEYKYQEYINNINTFLESETYKYQFTDYEFTEYVIDILRKNNKISIINTDVNLK